jgi:hypothetical protein
MATELDISCIWNNYECGANRPAQIVARPTTNAFLQTNPNANEYIEYLKKNDGILRTGEETFRALQKVKALYFGIMKLTRPDDKALAERIFLAFKQQVNGGPFTLKEIIENQTTDLAIKNKLLSFFNNTGIAKTRKSTYFYDALKNLPSDSGVSIKTSTSTPYTRTEVVGLAKLYKYILPDIDDEIQQESKSLPGIVNNINNIKLQAESTQTRVMFLTQGGVLLNEMNAITKKGEQVKSDLETKKAEKEKKKEELVKKLEEYDTKVKTDYEQKKKEYEDAVKARIEKNTSLVSSQTALTEAKEKEDVFTFIKAINNILNNLKVSTQNIRIIKTALEQQKATRQTNELGDSLNILLQLLGKRPLAIGNPPAAPAQGTSLIQRIIPQDNIDELATAIREYSRVNSQNPNAMRPVKRDLNQKLQEINTILLQYLNKTEILNSNYINAKKAKETAQANQTAKTKNRNNSITTITEKEKEYKTAIQIYDSVVAAQLLGQAGQAGQAGQGNLDIYDYVRTTFPTLQNANITLPGQQQPITKEKYVADLINSMQNTKLSAIAPRPVLSVAPAGGVAQPPAAYNPPTVELSERQTIVKGLAQNIIDTYDLQQQINEKDTKNKEVYQLIDSYKKAFIKSIVPVIKAVNEEDIDKNLKSLKSTTVDLIRGKKVGFTGYFDKNIGGVQTLSEDMYKKIEAYLISLVPTKSEVDALPKQAPTANAATAATAPTASAPASAANQKKRILLNLGLEPGKPVTVESLKKAKESILTKLNEAMKTNTFSSKNINAIQKTLMLLSIEEQSMSREKGYQDLLKKIQAIIDSTPKNGSNGAIASNPKQGEAQEKGQGKEPLTKDLEEGDLVIVHHKNQMPQIWVFGVVAYDNKGELIVKARTHDINDNRLAEYNLEGNFIKNITKINEFVDFKNIELIWKTNIVQEYQKLNVVLNKITRLTEVNIAINNGDITDNAGINVGFSITDDNNNTQNYYAPDANGANQPYIDELYFTSSPFLPPQQGQGGGSRRRAPTRTAKSRHRTHKRVHRVKRQTHKKSKKRQTQKRRKLSH